MTSLSGLQAFVETARCGTFVGAAESLGLSPSAVSKAVRRLEERLRTKLLHRTTRSLSLTGEGAALLEQASRLLGELQDLSEGASGDSALRGVLRLSVPQVLGQNALLGPLAHFLVQHAGLRLEMRFDNRLVDLADEAIDVAVRTGELADSAQLIVTRFFTYQSKICAAPALLRQFGAVDSLQGVLSWPVLHFQMPHRRPLPWRVLVEGEERQVELPEGHAFDDLGALARAAAAGWGVALLPPWACCDQMERGELVELLPQHRSPRKPVWLAYHDRRHVSARVMRFVEAMKGFEPELTSRYC